MSNSRLLSWLLLPAAVFAPSAAAACAVCLTGAPGTDPLADAIGWSVLFLMATPYAVIGSIAGWLFYNYRRKRRAEKRPALRLAWDKESGR